MGPCSTPEKLQTGSFGRPQSPWLWAWGKFEVSGVGHRFQVGVLKKAGASGVRRAPLHTAC